MMTEAEMVAAMAEKVSGELQKRDAALALIRARLEEMWAALEVVKAAPVVTLETIPEPVVVKGERGEKGDPGADGPGVTSARVAPTGELFFTLETAGEYCVGNVRGEPGAKGDPGETVLGPPGPPGEKGDPGERGPEGVGTKGDRGTDGRDGRDGKDGVASLDEIKTIATKAVDDRIEAEVQKRVAEVIASLPVVLYKGVFREGEEYAHGSVVTWAGSAWHAEEATKEKPGDGKTAWVLMVKKGRDGRA